MALAAGGEDDEEDDAGKGAAEAEGEVGDEDENGAAIVRGVFISGFRCRGR